jgi:DNA helicase HerA-like ATPase
MATLHPADKVRSITVAFGKTGMGKTVWTQQYVRTLKRCIILDPLMEYRDAAPFDDAAELIEHLERYRVFRVSMWDVMQFPLLCKIAKAVTDCTLVIEEAQRILPPHMELVPEFAELVYRGRHTRTSLVIVSQRATTVHIAARSQWTRLITFAQSESADVKWIQDVTGLDIEPSSLPPLEYFDVTPRGYERKKLVVSRRRETISEPSPSRPDEERGRA